MPLVSIVIPVYNGANFMREAIDSALAQTYGNCEVIVVNDGSRDDGATDAIARSYGERIRYFAKENGGVSSALNTGIRNMSGAYFSWLSHDDLYLPDKVKSQVETLLSLGREDALGICETKTINREGKEISSVSAHTAVWTRREVGEFIPWEIALTDVIEDCSYSGCALLIPRTVFEKTGLFDESLRFCQDLHMWMRVFLAGFGLVRTPGAEVCSRVHEGQLTQTSQQLFRGEIGRMGEDIVPQLAQKATKEHNFLYPYARYNAIYGCRPVVERILSAGADRGLFTAAGRLKIRLLLAYGRVRPLIRRLYYLTFRRMKSS